MSRKFQKDFISVFDIGTSKITALIGEIDDDQVEIIGVGITPSKGLKRGMVVNIDAAVQAIHLACEAAEKMAGCKITMAYAGIAGSHIRSLNSHGIVAIRNQEVAQVDIERVIDAARAVAIPADQKILHILPQEFIVDTQEGIREPIGMSGVRLEAKVHMVTGAASAAQNIAKCIERCGIQIVDVILEQLASSYAVLTEDEKELGVCLVDIGGGTTDIAIFTGGAIRHTSVIPVAGDQVTNDIAIALRTPSPQAEEIKTKYANAFSDFVTDETIDIPSLGDRPRRNITQRALSEIVEPRYEELFSLIKAELRRSGFEDLIAAGIVLTGGSANVRGCLDLAEKVFKVPVRIGIPESPYVKGKNDLLQNPAYSTAVGLLLYAFQQYNLYGTRRTSGLGLSGFLNRFREWFQTYF